MKFKNAPDKLLSDQLDQKATLYCIGAKNTPSMKFEKREYVRYLVKGNIFAALRNGFKKVGKVYNISINGAGFNYLNIASEPDIDSQESNVDIFLSENGFHIYNIPCRIAYDIAEIIPDENYSIKMCRCGLHFGKLSDMQLELLKFIIAKHSVKKGLIKADTWNDE